MDTLAIAQLVAAAPLLQTLILVGIATWVWTANAKLLRLSFQVDQLREQISACAFHQMGVAHKSLLNAHHANGD